MQQFDISTILSSLKMSYGKDFLDTIAMQLHKAIDADFTFIAKLDRNKFTSNTLTLVAGETFADNFEYSLTHTPCADVSQNNTCIYPERICAFYPHDQLLIDMGVEGYVGAPLQRADGEVFGLVVALYKSKIQNPQDVGDLFELFSGRIAAEVERLEKQEELESLNEALEKRVEERTQELKDTIVQLKSSQERLIQQEKLASLGRLVAGVAHEVNTPLGVSVLAASTTEANIVSIQKKLSKGQVSKAALMSLVNDSLESQKTVNYNLQRASQLIMNFKQMATESYVDEITDVDLTTWLPSLFTSLKPLLKETDIELCATLPEAPYIIRTYPSRLAQVITNVFTNAINHAFPHGSHIAAKCIKFSLTLSPNEAKISIRDNGVGMKDEAMKNILEPFYTTARASGSAGLGMTIANNLLTKSMNGQLDISTKEGVGTEVVITLSDAKEN
ncbi:sensor histidine kinase [Alteromonas sediminis]|uniref:histidine kinase n=1 Tax=Alteromonas sediminis TaxID=2259342 RepID=A0A3N5Z8M3_9ALTE|nr:ATP-binding protein [Alteromonas sediminis]RPJ67234.1 sensor histidine kinase [Alteromonas sediminis]